MTRRTPLAELERLVDEMQARFDDATRGTRELAGAYAPSIDVVEYDDEYQVAVDLPGFESDDVDVRVGDRTLSVEGETESASEADDDGHYVRRERRWAAAKETVTFPSPVDADGVTAELENGVLTVTVPKAAPEETGHRVEVE